MSDKREGARRRRHAAQREAARRSPRRQGLRGRHRRQWRRSARESRLGKSRPDPARRDDARAFRLRRLQAACAPIPATALLPIVLVTSLDPQGERVKGIEAGADDFLPKPINQAELFARVRSLLRVKSLQDEVKRQAEALKEWNARLEERVAEQVTQLKGMAQLKRFFAPAVADAIVSAGEKSILTPHRREISYVFADLRGFTAFTDSAEPEEVESVLQQFHATMGCARRRIRGNARPLCRRRHPDLLQRSAAGAAMPRGAQRGWRSHMQQRFCDLARTLVEARLRARSGHRDRAGLCDARRVRLRRPRRLHGDRQRRESRRSALRQGRARRSAHRPQDARGAR